MRLSYFVIYGNEDPEEMILRMKLAGCVPGEGEKTKVIFWDRIKKMSDPRPERRRVLENVRDGDELLVPSLFDIAGKWKNIRLVGEKLKNKGVKLLVGIDEQIEYSPDVAFLISGYVKRHSKFQTKAGNRSRKNRSSPNAGRPPGPADKERALRGYIMYNSVREDGRKRFTVKHICEVLNCSKNTLYYSYIPYGESQLKNK